MQDPFLERTFRGHKEAVTSVAFAAGQPLKQLVSGSVDGSLMLWSFKPQLRAFRFLGHRDAVTHVEFAPSGQLIASASQDRTVRLWLPNARGESTELKGHSGAVRSVSFSRDCRHLITASDDKTVKVWGLPSKKFKCTLTGHSNWVRSAAFSPDARLAVSGSDDKLVKLWDVNSAQVLHDFNDHEGGVNKVLFGADGTCVASASSDCTVKLWDARSYRLLQHYAAHDAPITGLAMHPSGLYLMSSSEDTTVKIWDLREGQLLYTLRGHEPPSSSHGSTAKGAPTACAFSPGAGTFLASGGADKRVLVWKTNLDEGAAWVNDGGSPASEYLEASTPQASAKPFAAASSSSRSMTASPRSPAKASPAQPLRPTNRANTGLSVSSSQGGRELHHKEYRVDDVRCEGERTVIAPPPHVGAATSTSYQASAPLPPAPLMTSSGAAAPPNLSRDALPEVLTSTLDHIVGQLDMLTRTMQILEARVSHTEDRIAAFTHVHDESVPPDQFYGEGFEATFPADPPPAGIDSYGDISEGAGGHSGY